jgi:hypothetical protein
VNIYVVGGAGAGKTTLSRRLSSHLSCPYVNLDPATPQEGADFDVRAHVRTEDIMKQYDLGINGALLRSMEVISSSFSRIADEICALGDFKVIDTPGQLEVFLHGDAARRIMEHTARCGANVLLHVVDASMCRTFEGFLAAFALTLFVEMRLETAGIVVFTKSDLLAPEDREHILTLCSPEGFEEAARARGNFTGGFALSMREFLSYLSITSRPLLVSAVTGEGLEELIDLLHEVQCSCGDLT